MGVLHKFWYVVFSLPFTSILFLNLPCEYFCDPWVTQILNFQIFGDFLDVIFFLFLLFKLIYLIYLFFWLCWVFVAAHGLSLVAASRGYSSLWCMGFSLQWLLLLRSTDSRCMGFSSCGMWAPVVVARGLSSCGSWALERRLSSCGTRA